MEQSVLDLMMNPLVQEGRSSSIIRLILAECAAYGMPPQIIATLDDVVAMLGYYDPLPANKAAHLGGPLIQWRTDRRQPSWERTTDVERLVFKQRALMAFGGGAPEHMVGTAEIVVAMGNCHREFMPDGWFDVFAWAATDVQHLMDRQPKEAIFAEHEWPVVNDKDVLKPDGKFNSIYITIATEIRRTAIAALRDDPDGARASMRPLGEHFLRAHMKVKRQADDARDPVTSAMMDRSIGTIRAMYPDLEAELAAQDRAVEEAESSELD